MFGHTWIISFPDAAARPRLSTSYCARSSCWVPVFTVPTTIAVRSGSRLESPASASASEAAAIACWANGTVPAITFSSSHFDGSKSSTGAHHSNRSGSSTVQGT